MSPLTNVILNPSAEGATASLVGASSTAVTMVADATTGAGARAYRLGHASAGYAAASLRAAERPTVVAGQRVWGRARCRLDPATLGARKISGKLVYRDASGNILPFSQQVIGSGSGAVHRWRGTPYASNSERVEGGRTRTNLFFDPTAGGQRDQWGTYYGPDRSFETNTDAPHGGTAFVITTHSTASGDVPEGMTAFGSKVGSDGGFVNLAGETVTASFFMQGPAGTVVNVAGRTAYGEGQNARQATLTGAWQRFSVTYPVSTNVGAVYDVGVQMNVTRLAGYTSQRFRFTGMLIEVADEAGDFFCGATPNTGSGYSDQLSIDLIPSGVLHRWTGAVNNSPSERFDGATRRVNMIADPAPVGPWGTYAGNGSTATTDLLTSPDMPSGRAFRATWTVPPTDGWNMQRAFAGVTAGTRVTFTLWGRASWAGAVARPVVEFKDASGVSLGYNYGQAVPMSATTPAQLVWSGVAPKGATNGNVFFDNGSSVLPTANTWAELSSAMLVEGNFTDWFSGASASTGTGNTQEVIDVVVVGDAPAGAVRADLLIYRDPAYQATASDVEFVDQVLLAFYDRDTPPPNGDGSVPGWYWNGASHASTSSYGRGAPLATADDRSWSVALRFDSLFPATQTMTVTAITPEGTYPVRSGDHAYAAGGLVITDFEPPPGVDVTYRGQMFAGDGTDLGFTDSTAVRYDVDPSMVIFSDPLSPGDAVLVEAKGDFGRRRARSRQGNTYRVGSRTFGLYAPLGLFEGLNLTVQTKTTADTDRLERVLEAMPVLVRSMPPVRMPRQLYVAVEAPAVDDVDVQFGGGWSVFALQGAQVSRTVTDVVVPVVTWQIYLDAFASWAEFNAAYANWLDAQENPPEAANARTG